jgi:hypothetical protein
MRFVVGIWVATLGYALAYSGGSYFSGNKVGLVASFGLSGGAVGGSSNTNSGGPTTWLGANGQVTGVTGGSAPASQLQPTNPTSGVAV